jgi:uncharacterized membrane protein YphA (DoxX/SURF4 family)
MGCYLPYQPLRISSHGFGDFTFYKRPGFYQHYCIIAARQMALLLLGIAWAQLSGGVLIVLGLFTRWACLLQLLMVTVTLLIKFSNYTLSDYALLEIIAVLLALILVLEKGGGAVSLDQYFRFNKADHLIFWA